MGQERKGMGEKGESERTSQKVKKSGVWQGVDVVAEKTPW